MKALDLITKEVAIEIYVSGKEMPCGFTLFIFTETIQIYSYGKLVKEFSATEDEVLKIYIERDRRREEIRENILIDFLKEIKLP